MPGLTVLGPVKVIPAACDHAAGITLSYGPSEQYGPR
ncbi:hypothetical protein M2167_008282 [Streptomyces sp. SPB4]|nr:hypothetical protein [Streptomyces sp. SPB4]MDH6545704.1 hypothetical protein [Streptomyces sp. SPB4]